MTPLERSRRSPALASFVALALVLIALSALPLALGARPFELRLFTVIFLYATLGHAWNILGGYAGQTSLGHGVLFGLGAYCGTLLLTQAGTSPWIGMLAGAALASAVGVVLGFVGFRLRGHYFVIATLVVAESVYLLFSGWEWVGAALGLQIPIAEEGLASFQFHRNKAGYYYVALGLLAATTLLVWWLERSRIGMVLRAIRDDEDAVRSLGFSPLRYKLSAMALSAAICGAGGVFYAQFVLFIDPPSVLALSLSVLIALIPILGGAGTLAGPILGAAVLIPISEYSRIYFSGSGRNIDLLIYGFLIMVMSVYRPDGLASLLRGVPSLWRSIGAATRRSRQRSI
jgi:branched-chain amino acid transport system permease protein